MVALAAAAGDDVPARGEGAGVHRPERGRGQGEEHPRVLGDGVGHVLGVVAGESGAQQVEGVGGVAVRAGRADRGAAVAARGEHGPGAFEQHGAVAVEDAGGAAQVDGCGAAAGGFDLGAPCAVVRCAQAGGSERRVRSSSSRDAGCRSGGWSSGLRVARSSAHQWHGLVGRGARQAGVHRPGSRVAPVRHARTARRWRCAVRRLVGPGGWALQPFPARDPVPGGLRDQDGGADQVRGAAGDVVGGAEGQPAAAQELVHGVFLVAGHPGDPVVGVGAGVDAFGGADEQVAAADGVGRHGHHQVDVVGLDPRRRPLRRDRGRGGRVAEQVELPGPRPVARGHGDHHQDERAS